MNNEEIKEFFKKDRFAGFIGAEIDSLSVDSVVCSMKIGDKHLNAGDKVQGGAVFTLADFTFAVSSNYSDLAADINNITVAQSNNIVFFKPAAGTTLFAKSECIQKGRKISVYRVTVTDDLGTKVAEMTGNGYTVSLDKSN